MTFDQVFPIAFGLGFPVVFAAFWLLIVSLLSAMSGWKGLAARFPDREDEAVDTIRMASGYLGGVRMNNMLTMTACRSGLRIAMWKLFGPFDRPFFVPWEQLGVERGEHFTTLVFGSPPQGQMRVRPALAGRLAAAAQSRGSGGPASRNAPIVS